MNTMEGDNVVFAPDPTANRELAENSLGETSRASLAFSQGEIFQRTYHHLYFISEKSAAPGE